MLRLDRVCKNWREFRLRDISFEVKRGEYFVILGHSGAGKTLLLEIIAGIYKPDSGRVFLKGVDVTDYPPEKRNVGYIPQNYALFPHLTVYENIAYGLKLRGLEKEEIREKVEGLADVFGIKHLLHRKPKTLSGGEQQRVAIARALAIEPEILLLDEPFSNLDITLKEKLMGELVRWREEIGFTAVHVTHDIGEIRLADRICVMAEGRIVMIKDNFSFDKLEYEHLLKVLDRERW